jgi:hypothetical protein
MPNLLVQQSVLVALKTIGINSPKVVLLILRFI